ncbi:hypothetical protein [Streptomyces sp. cg35]|uniref:hypothetical protein n=1 Tax=Streptomyces sp. cg35 TaxID=3421650 RepID=UPI003D182D33
MTHTCRPPFPSTSNTHIGDIFTCECGHEYELVFTGFWRLPLRLRRLCEGFARLSRRMFPGGAR